jgi:hypothetical protein
LFESSNRHAFRVVLRGDHAKACFAGFVIFFAVRRHGGRRADNVGLRRGNAEMRFLVRDAVCQAGSIRDIKRRGAGDAIRNDRQGCVRKFGLL